jgi:hypothetical protein
MGGGLGGIVGGGLGGIVGGRVLDGFNPVCGSLTINKKVRDLKPTGDTSGSGGIEGGEPGAGGSALSVPDYSTSLVDIDSIYNAVLPIHIQNIAMAQVSLNNLAKKVVSGEG